MRGKEMIVTHVEWKHEEWKEMNVWLFGKEEGNRGRKE